MIINDDDDDATSDLLGNFSKINTKLETSNSSLWDDGEIRKAQINEQTGLLHRPITNHLSMTEYLFIFSSNVLILSGLKCYGTATSSLRNHL